MEAYDTDINRLRMRRFERFLKVILRNLKLKKIKLKVKSTWRILKNKKEKYRIHGNFPKIY